MKKIVMMLVMAITVVDVFALTERVGNITWTYTIANGEATVYGRYEYVSSTSYYYPAISKTTTGAVVIPEKLGGYLVTAISSYAFYGCTGITSVQVPGSVRSIGASAFYGCTGLSSVSLSEGLDSIAGSAFYNCSSLMSLSIPKSVTSIASGAFTGTGLYNAVSEGFVIVDGCVVGIKGVMAGEVKIPEGCWLVASSLFGWSVGSNITSIELPDSLKVICNQAFYYCNISSIHIPSGVSRIVGNPFYYCNNLKTIDIALENQYYKVVDGLLMDRGGTTVVCCSATKTSVTIPAGVTKIGDYAFYYCSSLSRIELPRGLKEIGNYAFYYCSNLDSIVFPEGLESIGSSAFLYCLKISSVTIPNSVKKIGGSVFGSLWSSGDGCALSRVDMPGAVSVGMNVFTNCPSLKSIHVTDEVGAKSAKQAFVAGGNAVEGLEFWSGEFEAGCLNLGVNAEDEVVVLGIGAQLSDGHVQIPSRIGDKPVTKILENAFKNEMSIRTVSILDCIKGIAVNAFTGCKNIETIHWDNNWAGEILVPMNDEVWNVGPMSAECRVAYTTSVNPSYNKSIKFALDNSSHFIYSMTDSSTYSYSVCYSSCYIDGQSSGSYANLSLDSEHIVEVLVNVSSGYGTYDGTVTVKRGLAFCDWFKDARSFSVVVGPHVSRLPGGLFADCKNLRSVTIPENVSSIGTTTFYGCSALNELVVDPGNVTYKSVAGSLFSADGKTLIWAKGSTAVLVPEGVETIGRCAFAGKENLRSVVIPSTVKTIEDYAFDGCYALSRVDIPAGVTRLGRKSFSPIGEVAFFANPPTGFSTSGLGNSAKILIPRKYAGVWKSYVTANNYAIRRGSTAAILSSKIRESDPTVMDIEYMVTSESPTVKVRALAFKNGVRSFANVVRPETFVDGTAINIGDAIEANVPHKLSWRVSADYGIELTKMKFEVIAQEGDLLPMEWIYIPKSEQYGKMKVSYNTLSEAQVFDALMWLYAAKDPGLTLSGGTLRGGGYTLASGAGLYNTQGSYVSGVGYTYNYYAHNYVFAKMGWSVLSGAVLNYANSETRKGLSPSGIRQYAYQIVE